VQWDGGKTSYFRHGELANVQLKPIGCSPDFAASKVLIEDGRGRTRHAFEASRHSRELIVSARERINASRDLLLDIIDGASRWDASRDELTVLRKN
jgi:hypothetical protein